MQFLPRRRSRPHHGPVPEVRAWIRRHEILVLGLLAGGVWAFVLLARYVGRGEVDDLDRQLLLVLRNPDDMSDPLGPRWLEELVRDFTALGGTGALALLTLAAFGGLLLLGKLRTGLTALGAIAGGLVLSHVLKLAFERERPDLVPHGSYVYTKSFPSGHSMLAAVTYLTLAAVLARVQPTRVLKVYVMSLALLLTLLVGFSRVYLGVHWPSDVLAGWCAGIVWALAVWLVTRRFQRQGTIEPEPEEEPASS